MRASRDRQRIYEFEFIFFNVAVFLTCFLLIFLFALNGHLQKTISKQEADATCLRFKKSIKYVLKLFYHEITHDLAQTCLFSIFNSQKHLCILLSFSFPKSENIKSRLRNDKVFMTKRKIKRSENFDPYAPIKTQAKRTHTNFCSFIYLNCDFIRRRK